MAEKDIQSLREQLIKIEGLLQNIINTNDLKLEAIEEKLKVANKRIENLESSNRWLWRAVASALISAAIAFLIKI
ncbi:MAG: hemolysin XhlA family protein [Sarcina sp.]